MRKCIKCETINEDSSNYCCVCGNYLMNDGSFKEKTFLGSRSIGDAEKERNLKHRAGIAEREYGNCCVGESASVAKQKSQPKMRTRTKVLIAAGAVTGDILLLWLAANAVRIAYYIPYIIEEVFDYFW